MGPTFRPQLSFPNVHRQLHSIICSASPLPWGLASAPLPCKG